MASTVHARYGRPLAVGFDEFDRLSKVDNESRASGWPNLSGWSDLRKRLVWPAYLSGAQFEFITEDLLGTENYRPYEGMWKYAWYARKFMEENFPFADMVPADPLLAGTSGEVLALPGKIYAIYLPKASATAQLDLAGAPGQFEAKWYNPRAGVFTGTPSTLTGGGKAGLPAPPASPDQDWALVVKHRDYSLPTGISSGPKKQSKGQLPLSGKEPRRWFHTDECGILRELSGRKSATPGKTPNRTDIP